MEAWILLFFMLYSNIWQCKLDSMVQSQTILNSFYVIHRYTWILFLMKEYNRNTKLPSSFWFHLMGTSFPNNIWGFAMSKKWMRNINLSVALWFPVLLGYNFYISVWLISESNVKRNKHTHTHKFFTVHFSYNVIIIFYL